jgi:NAD(P)H-dependent flavin oxidoreductase YrpB (nitropropane dioxygenase family)
MPILEGARQAGMKEVAPGIAGQSVGLIKKIRPAREVVEEMVREAIEILEERLPRTVRTH